MIVHEKHERHENNKWFVNLGRFAYTAPMPAIVSDVRTGVLKTILNITRGGIPSKNPLKLPAKKLTDQHVLMRSRVAAFFRPPNTRQSSCIKKPPPVSQGRLD